MIRALLSYTLVLIAVSLAACGPGDGDHGDDPPVLSDRDGDTIADIHEGCDEGRDTDGDGVPDCEDLDSDGDGIPDAVEAGDDDVNTPPIDSDGDGIPDFMDLDSDNNGIPDAVEGYNDTDGDGIGDYADFDNDGDGLPDVLEIGPDPDNPLDTDGDGIPDYMDLDSDNDTILDAHEGADDPDGDGIPSFRDLDSDGDCIPDIIEAGDQLLSTPPIDTDGDGIPDYKDLDSDGDGLPDWMEDTNCNGIHEPPETDARRPDTDGDGVSDLVEVVAGTDPNDPTDNPRVRGDFVFVMPYQRPPDPEEDDLHFATDIQILDVYVLVDRSGSMRAEIDSIRENIQTVANNVTCPPLGSGDPESCIPDIWWGVGTVGYTGLNGQSYTNHLDVQPNPALITNALPTTEPPGGFDEPLLLGLWSTCTGGNAADAGCSVATPYPRRGSCATSPAAGAGLGGIGYPCFRATALPIILLATDEPPSYTYNCPVMPVVAAAANTIGAKIIGVLGSTHDTRVRPDLEDLAVSTGAVDAMNDNEPLVFQGEDENAAAAMETAIRLLSRGLPLDITAVAVDDPSDDIDAVETFISRLETQQLGSDLCSGGLLDEDSSGNGFADRYLDVLPGTPVCWKLVPRMNVSVPPTREPQLFRSRIEVYGDGVTLLDQRNVFFLVPPLLAPRVD